MEHRAIVGLSIEYICHTAGTEDQKLGRSMIFLRDKCYRYIRAPFVCKYVHVRSYSVNATAACFCVNTSILCMEAQMQTSPQDYL